MKAKSPLVSKVIWFNVLSGAAAAIQAISPYLTPAQAGIAATVVGAINIALRFMTREPVGIDTGA